MADADGAAETGGRPWDLDYSRHRPTLWSLGLGGLVPFVLPTAALLYAGREFIAFDLLVKALGGYSAVILSFLGGIRWGSSLMTSASGRGTLILSIVPALVGWILLFLPAPWLFAGFALAFLLQGVWDVLAIRRGALPLYFRKLRVTLTVVVVVCQIASFVATYGAAASAA
ncbi:hypothetical protein GCM10011390_11760 [Aureimonas endophytica]|uniref:DUF3429 domain-containing protein n=1 Tax=Aureimonas endophytica TaxID=2027858 RepID=A0A916ZFQ6_9HYPH|nr:DUF3429 domain-containing protein [Aureimonas endophytica]GGD94643.1 hypothetical protein GCM10011390_11760 [Aureimonas endophytica]